MTVKALIALLQRCNPDARVYYEEEFCTSDGTWMDQEIDVIDVADLGPSVCLMKEPIHRED